VRVGQRGLQVRDALLEFDHGLFEVDDPLDPGQVDTVLLLSRWISRSITTSRAL